MALITLLSRLLLKWTTYIDALSCGYFFQAYQKIVLYCETKMYMHSNDDYSISMPKSIERNKNI